MSISHGSIDSASAGWSECDMLQCGDGLRATTSTRIDILIMRKVKQ